MSFKEVDLKISYKSIGEESLSEIINPILTKTKIYKRSVGFFSSSALNFISEGILDMANKGGKIFLATSPKLSPDDVEAIKMGYDQKQKYYEKFVDEFKTALEELDDQNLKILSFLIFKNILDIKIVKKKNGGMYHDKLAILIDNDDNVLVFQGSNNETANGYDGNYEKVRVYKSWNDFEGRIIDETEEFESIWENSNNFLDVFSFEDALKKQIIEIVESQIKKNSEKKPKYELRQYQEDAIEAWKNKNYNGFYIMATGTGKTVTAIFSIKKLYEYDNDVFTIIAVPYIHLVKQWLEDVKDILPDFTVYQAFSEIKNWDDNIINAIFYNKFNKDKKKIIVITTIQSLCTERFESILKSIKTKKLLVVDEAHNFYNQINLKKFNTEYKLGLSATPVFGKNVDKSRELLEFFGGTVFSLPIEQAIGKFLVNYEYHPIFVYATDEEETKFGKLSYNMTQCFDKNGKIKDPDKFNQIYKARLRVISMAEEKINKLTDIIKDINPTDHFIVYCSDGKIYDDNNEMKHLRYALQVLNDLGYKPSKFTADENIHERISLINNFNKGYISTLVAIRCLDEGINIPSIEKALILSSNDNYREFVQRRGRILRKYGDKNLAHIYDIIVLPSPSCKGIAEIEFRRFNEYAKLAINKDRDKLIEKLEMYMRTYCLTYDEIEMDIDDLYEGELDE